MIDNTHMHQKPFQKRATIHNMKRRAPWHNYSSPGLYMITLVVKNRKQILGTLLGEPRPNVRLSNLGHRILFEEIPKISHFYPNVKVWKTIVMPDHIHFIIYVSEHFDKKKNLGNVLLGFKTGCNRVFRELLADPTDSLFEEGYNDKILTSPDDLRRWQKYLDDNPRRLWIKRNYPQFFTVIHNEEIAGHKCSMVGNKFLLDMPEKAAVIFHRRYSPEELDLLYRQYMQFGENGGVLVSASIAKWEKLIIREALNKGYKLILLRQNGFSDLYKPSGKSFDACHRGQILQISPFEYHTEKVRLTREQCLLLNSLAEKIVSNSISKQDR